MYHLQSNKMMKILKLNLIAVLKLRAVRFNLLLLMMGCFSVALSAQNITVSGMIKDSSGEPLIGVSVQLKGTQTGTVTDYNGKFSLAVPANAPLTFSYIGYTSQTVAAQPNLTVVMLEDTKNLDEVVVVGYGTQKKTTLTGSVTQVRGDEVLKGKATTNVAAALQGEIPGLTITRTSSRPGNEGTAISLRGGISVNSVSPMIVIDGVDSYEWELSQINPNDIETVSVLKDASAAIYGTRAAGGVILITTKRGKEGKVKVNYSGRVNTNVVGKRFPTATGQEWALMMNEAITNDAVTNGGTKAYWMFDEAQLGKLMNNESFYEKINMGTGNLTQVDPTADQFDAIYGTTYGQSHNLTISGGNEKTRILTSLGYAQDRSLIDVTYDGQKKYNFRTNLDYNVNKWIKTEFNLSYDNRTVTAPTQGIGQGIQDFYTFPLINNKGQYYDVFGKNNVLAKLVTGGASNNREELLRLGGKTTFDLGFLVKGLSASANANIKIRNGLKIERQLSVSMYDWVNENGIGDVTGVAYPFNTFKAISPSENWVKNTYQENLYQSYGGFLNYDRGFGNHNISLMGGVTAEKSDYMQLYSYRSGMADNSLDDINTGDALTAQATGGSNDWGLVSYLGRANYNYKEIYLIEGLFRRDGSSKLSPENRWANFAGVSGGIRISEFEAIKNMEVFSNLKLRASYGETGSLSGIGNYDYVSGISTNTTVFGYTGTKATTAWISQVTTANRTWERVATTDIGLDFAVLNNRLSGTFDWYLRENKGMLIAMTYPQVYGATAPKTNSGNFKAKGWELALNWNDKIGKDFTYKVGFSLNDANTEVTKYNGAVAITNGYKNNNPNESGTSWIEGKPLYALYVYKTDGYLQDQAAVDAYYPTVNATGSIVPKQGTVNALQPGCVKKVDMNGDGKITTDDLYYLGDAAPHLLFGISLGASYKGVDFNLFIQGVAQQNIVRDGTMAGPFWVGYQNQNSTFLGNTWTTTNTSARYPLMSRNGDRNNWNYKWYNDINVNNISYARAKTMSLGYSLPKLLVKKVGVENLRLYLSADNLFEISNVKDGFDPESKVASGQGNMDVFARTFSCGIDLTF